MELEEFSAWKKLLLIRFVQLNCWGFVTLIARFALFNTFNGDDAPHWALFTHYCWALNDYDNGWEILSFRINEQVVYSYHSLVRAAYKYLKGIWKRNGDGSAGNRSLKCRTWAAWWKLQSRENLKNISFSQKKGGEKLMNYAAGLDGRFLCLVGKSSR